MISLLLLLSASLAARPPCGNDPVIIGPVYTGTLHHPHIPVESAGLGQVCDLVSPLPWLDAWVAGTADDCDSGPAAALPLPAQTPLVICLEDDGTGPASGWTVPLLLVVSLDLRVKLSVSRWY